MPHAKPHLLSEWRGFLTATALAIGGMVILGLLGRWIFWFDLLSHVRVYLTIALVVVSLLLLFAQARLRAMLAFALCLISIGSLAWSLYGSPIKLEQNVSAEISILSFNVLAWNRTPDAAAQLIRESDVDIAVILEAPGIEDQLPNLRDVYPHQSGCEVSATCDLVIISKHPFVSIDRPGLVSGADRVAIAELEIDGKPVHVAGIHLSKPYYDGVHAWEMSVIRNDLDAIDGPLILVGDVNQAPWSAILQRFMRDAQLSAIAGYRPTWPDQLGLLGVPIDTMLIRGEVGPVSLKVLPNPAGSNHRALLGAFSLSN
ncbi:MAG: endonuclease/exonuclease/phosphatase family protein [Pseudomonadota bacterium]